METGALQSGLRQERALRRQGPALRSGAGSSPSGRQRAGDCWRRGEPFYKRSLGALSRAWLPAILAELLDPGLG